MKIEVKKDENKKYYVFVNDEKTDIGCDKCVHWRGSDYCKMEKLENGETREDDKFHYMAGKVCGYFYINIKKIIGMIETRYCDRCGQKIR